MLVNALPMGLKMSIAAGIGLFLSLSCAQRFRHYRCQRRDFGEARRHPSTRRALGVGGLRHGGGVGPFRVKGAIILTILALTAISTLLGLSEFKGVVGEIPSIAPTFMQMDFNGLFKLSMISVIFCLLSG